MCSNCHALAEEKHALKKSMLIDIAAHKKHAFVKRHGRKDIVMAGRPKARDMKKRLERWLDRAPRY